MLTSLAEIWTLAWQGLGAPETENARLQIMRAVNEVSALKWSGVRQSNQNQFITKTDEVGFNESEHIYDLSDAWTGPVIPAWVELRANNRQFGDTSEFNWQPVTVCNRDALQSFRNRGEQACSFYSVPNDGQPTTTDYIEWAYTPLFSNVRGFRVWYSPNIDLATLDSAASGFPPEFNYYLAILARIQVIPVFITQLLEDADQNDRNLDIVKLKIQNWERIAAQARVEAAEWEPQFKYWKNQARGQKPSRKKRKIYNTYL